MITTHKKLRTKAAEILHGAGYHPDKSLDFVGYPKVDLLEVRTELTNATQSLNIKDERTGEERVIDGELARDKQLKIRPAATTAKVTLTRGATGNYAAKTTIIKAKYSDGRTAAGLLGEDLSGPNTNPETISTRDIQVPPNPDWPIPKFLDQSAKGDKPT